MESEQRLRGTGNTKVTAWRGCVGTALVESAVTFNPLWCQLGFHWNPKASCSRVAPSRWRRGGIQPVFLLKMASTHANHYEGISYDYQLKGIPSLE